jgi:hypothetical protein
MASATGEEPACCGCPLLAVAGPASAADAMMAASMQLAIMILTARLTRADLMAGGVAGSGRQPGPRLSLGANEQRADRAWRNVSAAGGVRGRGR